MAYFSFSSYKELCRCVIWLLSFIYLFLYGQTLIVPLSWCYMLYFLTCSFVIRLGWEYLYSWIPPNITSIWLVDDEVLNKREMSRERHAKIQVFFFPQQFLQSNSILKLISHLPSFLSLRWWSSWELWESSSWESSSVSITTTTH